MPIAIDVPWAIFLVLISPAIGSFLGVLVERLPRGQSVFEPSHCASCGRRLPWSQMIPIVSALTLRQRCGFCGAAIPSHLIRIEIASVIVTLAALLMGHSLLHVLALLLTLYSLVALFYADLFYFRLPDPINAAFFVGACLVVYADSNRDLATALLSGAGAALAFALIRWGYAATRKREGMGLGDVKLAAGIGTLIGWQLTPIVILAAAFIALCAAGLDWLKGADAPKGSDAIPFGSYLCGATLLIMIL